MPDNARGDLQFYLDTVARARAEYPEGSQPLDAMRMLLEAEREPYQRFLVGWLLTTSPPDPEAEAKVMGAAFRYIESGLRGYDNAPIWHAAWKAISQDGPYGMGWQGWREQDPDDDLSLIVAQATDLTTEINACVSMFCGEEPRMVFLFAPRVGHPPGTIMRRGVCVSHAGTWLLKTLEETEDPPVGVYVVKVEDQPRTGLAAQSLGKEASGVDPAAQA